MEVKYNLYELNIMWKKFEEYMKAKKLILFEN